MARKSQPRWARLALCRRTPAGNALAGALRQSQHELAIDDLDLRRPQPHARIALVLTRADVELVPVPGADDIGVVLGKAQSHAGLVLSDQLLDAGNDLALADGPAHVRANVLECGEPAVAAKHPDLDAVDVDYSS